MRRAMTGSAFWRWAIAALPSRIFPEDPMDEVCPSRLKRVASCTP
jgi:hypothetical protein